MEINNPICTVQLRNIVYVHNQLVKYGEHNVYVKGFDSDNVLGGGEGNANKSMNIEANDDEEEQDGDGSSDEADDSQEMDPIKMIMDQLGNQYIILGVYEK